MVSKLVVVAAVVCGNSDRCGLCTAAPDDRRSAVCPVANIIDFAAGCFDGDKLVQTKRL